MESITRESLKQIIDNLDNAYLGLVYRILQQFPRISAPPETIPNASTKIQPETPQTTPLNSAFEQAGLIGCLETDEQLSTTYKDKLNFAAKHGDPA